MLMLYVVAEPVCATLYLLCIYLGNVPLTRAGTIKVSILQSPPYEKAVYQKFLDKGDLLYLPSWLPHRFTSVEHDQVNDSVACGADALARELCLHPS
eukprot:4635219-Pleurochrysis_carterae.AAC.1